MGQLWYEHPAVEWEEALPVGNGRIGGMVFAGPIYDRIILNEETLWSGNVLKRDVCYPKKTPTLPPYVSCTVSFISLTFLNSASYFTSLL